MDNRLVLKKTKIPITYFNAYNKWNDSWYQVVADVAHRLSVMYDICTRIYITAYILLDYFQK